MNLIFRLETFKVSLHFFVYVEFKAAGFNP